jgi:hypothetical protein
MPYRKFHIGEIVHLSPSILRRAAGGVYKVTKRLPDNAGEYEYRVKSTNEPHERTGKRVVQSINPVLSDSSDENQSPGILRGFLFNVHVTNFIKGQERTLIGGSRGSIGYPF